MQLNVIHLPQRTDRYDLLMKEIDDQGISDYRLWDGIVVPGKVATGISRAHRQIVQDAKDKGLPEVLIAEDDIHFTDKGALQYFLENKPEEYDLFLGSIYFGKLRHDHTIKDFSGLTLYIVHERFYDRFLSVPDNRHIDRALAYRGHFVVCDPFVAIQHNGYSDNVRKEVNYDRYMRGRNLFQAG